MQRHFILQCEEFDALGVISAQFSQGIFVALVKFLTMWQGSSKTPSADTMILYSKRKNWYWDIYSWLGSNIALNLILTQNLWFSTKENQPAQCNQIHAVMSLKCRTRLSLQTETKPSNKLKHKIRTWGSDECHSKHCFISVSHPFFFQWLLLTAGLIRNSQKILFKKKTTGKRQWFLLCFFLVTRLPFKDFSQNLISNFHPV